MKLFSNKDNEVAFANLANDYKAVCVALDAAITRLTEKSLGTLMESIEDEMLGTLTNEAADLAQDLVTDENTLASITCLMDAVHYLQRMDRIPHMLVEAYIGYYEREMARDLTVKMEEPEHTEAWARARIMSEAPKQWLDTYMHWHGLIGWTENVWDISHGMIDRIMGENN